LFDGSIAAAGLIQQAANKAIEAYFLRFISIAKYS
jgi:hypothetical protein